jgi:hypothetical protein
VTTGAWTATDRERLALTLRDLLPAPAGRARPTGWYAERLGMNGFEHSTVLWPVLARLTSLGLVERLTDPGSQSRLWRLTARGVEAPDNEWTARRRPRKEHR